MTNHITTVEKVSPLLLPIDQARAALGGLSRQSLYNLINAGQLETAKIGGRRFIVAESAKALVERSKV